MPFAWEPVREFTDIRYERFEGIAKITINRPEVRNAFRPETIFELQDAFADVRDDPSTGVVLLTGAGTEAFCSGGDQRIRGDGGYVDPTGVPRLNVLDLQRQILALMDFAPAISPELRLMDAALFDDAPMNLRERMLALVATFCTWCVT